MSFDLVPAELLASALIAATMAIPLAFALAASAITGPRRSWTRAGLALGLGLLLGVGLAVFGAVNGAESAPLRIAVALMLLGLLCAIAAGVLVIVLEDGTTLSTVVGVAACLLIGMGAPGEALPAFFGLSTSVLVVAAAVVIEAVALVAIVGFLVAAAGRVRALQIGVAAAGAIAALLVALGLLGLEIPLSTVLILTLSALVIGSVVSGVLDAVRGRRRPTVDARNGTGAA